MINRIVRKKVNGYWYEATLEWSDEDYAEYGGFTVAVTVIRTNAADKNDFQRVTGTATMRLDVSSGNLVLDIDCGVVKFSAPVVEDLHSKVIDSIPAELFGGGDRITGC